MLPRSTTAEPPRQRGEPRQQVRTGDTAQQPLTAEMLPRSIEMLLHGGEPLLGDRLSVSVGFLCLLRQMMLHVGAKRFRSRQRVVVTAILIIRAELLQQVFCVTLVRQRSGMA